MSTSTDTTRQPSSSPSLTSGQSTGSERLKRIVTSDWALAVWLVIINFACFHNALSGYFLSDDFTQVTYLEKVFHGHWQLLLDNFYSNWMLSQGSHFYRPLISVTYALDYLIWRLNPLGFHLTNLLYQTASTIFLFLSVRRLFPELSKGQSTWLGFQSAALFAVYPLHSMIVSWISARVDCVQTTFFLASLWLYLKARASSGKAGRLSRIASLSAFVLSLLSSEMAITMPPTLLFLEVASANELMLKDRVVRALSRTWTYWLILAFYLVVSALALGGASDGYSSSIGHGLSQSNFRRWIQDGTIFRLAFPLNVSLYPSSKALLDVLCLLYQITITLVIARLLFPSRSKDRSAKLLRLCFALGWFIISMAPVYQSWNLTENLQGSRFVYLATAPMVIFLALLLAPVSSFGNSKYSVDNVRLRAIDWSQRALVVAFIVIFGAICQIDNLPWIKASLGVKNFKDSIAKVVDRMSDDQVMVVLNIPQRQDGAHMLYNADAVKVLLTPPLSEKDYARRIATFEPITFGDSDLIIASRLKRYLCQPRHYKFFKWEAGSANLEPLNLTLSNREVELTANQFRKGKLLVSPAIDIPSTATAFVNIILKETMPSQEGSTPPISLLWNSPQEPDFSPNHRLARPNEVTGNVLRFKVGQHKSWVLLQTIHQIALYIPDGLEVESVFFDNGERDIASLSPDQETPNSSGKTMSEDVTGVCRPGKIVGLFSYDVSKIKDADHVLIEVSKADKCFENYTGELNDEAPSTHTSISKCKKELTSKSTSIDSDCLGHPGFYELRVAAVTKNRDVVGFFSDPLNIELSADDVRPGSHSR